MASLTFLDIDILLMPLCMIARKVCGVFLVNWPSPSTKDSVVKPREAMAMMLKSSHVLKVQRKVVDKMTPQSTGGNDWIVSPVFAQPRLGSLMPVGSAPGVWSPYRLRPCASLYGVPWAGSCGHSIRADRCTNLPRSRVGYPLTRSALRRQCGTTGVPASLLCYSDTARRSPCPIRRRGGQPRFNANLDSTLTSIRLRWAGRSGSMGDCCSAVLRIYVASYFVDEEARGTPSYVVARPRATVLAPTKWIVHFVFGNVVCL
ncbi:hypothetical protein C8R47DRAFT_1155609 [Mycena vitilis]|nr:hypothetical protein C8R47DRAFT_1155609 [Mycena vitilis]